MIAGRLLRQAELYAPVLVGLGGCWHIEVGYGDFSGTRLIENPERLPHDGIFLNFFGVLVAEDQYCFTMNAGLRLGL